MKKTFLTIGLCALLSLPAAAQHFSDEYDTSVFTHYEISSSIGTTGVSLDAATNITQFAGLRVGVDWIPGFAEFNTSADVNTNLNGLSIQKVKVTCDLGRVQGHLLADLFPFGHYFCITTGFYFGGRDLFQIEGSSNEVRDFLEKNPAQKGNINASFSGYDVTFQDNGSIKANLRVKSFRPYIGIGLGGLDSPFSRHVTARFEFGVQYMGEPAILVGGERAKLIENQSDNTKKLSHYLEKWYARFYPVAQIAIRIL